MSFTILQNKKKKTPFQAIKTRILKSRKIAIFPKRLTHCHFFSFLFLGNIGQKNVFYNILEQKKAFPGFKNEKFKKLKIGIFTKRLTHGFGPKMAVSPTFFFRQNRQGKMSFTTFQNEKMPFQAKKQVVQKVEVLPFF